MTTRRARWTWLLLAAGVAVLAGAAVVRWSARTIELLAVGRRDAIESRRTEEARSADRIGEENRSVERGEAERASDAAGAADPCLGSGSITFRFLDRVTAAPVPDLPFVVYSERPKLHVFTRGVSDQNGEATIERLPQDVVIVETPRAPPHASTIFATWLGHGERRRVDVPLARGGTVRGRVIDDLGRPLSGVELRIDPRPGGSTLASLQSVQEVDAEVARRFERTSVVVGTTDEAGRYEIAALRSRPRAIWIEGGAMSPKHEDEIQVSFRWRRARQSLSTRVGEGETVELRDVLFERVRRWSGRVVDDASGEPVAGALVTAQNRRRFLLGERAFELPRWSDPPITRSDEDAARGFDLAPWEAGFVLAEDEAVTGPDGGFELESSTANGDVMVVAPDQRRKGFDLPAVEPGGRRGDVELRLPTQTQLLLEVTEADGSPIRSPIDGKWPLQFGLQVTGVTRDGREVASGKWLAGPTLAGVTFEVDPRALARVVVRTPAHRPAVHELASPPLDRPTLRFALERKGSHELKLRFRFADDGERQLLGDRYLRVTVTAQSRDVDASVPGSDLDLLVFDFASFRPSSTPEVVLHVPALRPWHVAVDGPFGKDERGDGRVELGAFVPDSTLHEIVLPRVTAAGLAALEPRMGSRSDPTPRPKPGLLAARVCDAATGAFIEAGVEFVIPREGASSAAEQREPRRYGGTSRHALGQRWWTVALSPGEYALTVRATGYRESTPLTASVESNRPTSLGEVRLEKLPVLRVRVAHDDGTAVGAGWELVAEGSARAAVHEPPAARTDAEGIATLREDAPICAAWLLWPPGVERWRGGEWPARVVLESTRAGERIEVRLPPRGECEIRLDVSAVHADLRDAECRVELRRCDAPAERGWGARERAAELDGTRRFTLAAPIGRYVAIARGPFFEAPATELEITAATRSQLTLVARPR